MIRSTLLIALALTFAGNVQADTRKDVRAAFMRTLALKSYKVQMFDLTSKRMLSTVEFQAPDRYRITPGGQPPSMIIGDFMYINADGHAMKVPLPKQMLGQFRNKAVLDELEKDIQVSSLGPGMVGTVAAKKYSFNGTAGKEPSTSTVWIGVASGNVLQVETSGKSSGKPFAMRMLYSDWNSPAIQIVAPN